MTKEQLGTLIIESETTLWRVSKTMLHNDDDCADAIQETIVKAFSKLHTLRNEHYAKTWLVRILINECYALLRSHSTRSEIHYLLDIPQEESYAEQPDYSDLYAALKRLPEPMRVMVTLYYMEGYHVKEVASALDTTESTVKNCLSRARKRLRQDLGEKEAINE